MVAIAVITGFTQPESVAAFFTFGKASLTKYGCVNCAVALNALPIIRQQIIIAYTSLFDDIMPHETKNEIDGIFSCKFREMALHLHAIPSYLLSKVYNKSMKQSPSICNFAFLHS